MTSNDEDKIAQLKVPIVPVSEYWTKERLARRKREMKPVKGEKEFLKFMHEEIARQRVARRKEEEVQHSD